jgi:hypothetical protein
MNRVTFTMTALALMGLSIWAGNVRADKAQLEEKLKQELSIQLEDVTIAQALAQIGQKAGVKIELSPQAAWKLPEGEETRLSIALEGRLSESLEEMLNNFFLRYAVGGEALTIYPRAELMHLIGRPSANELQLLTNIYRSQAWIEPKQIESHTSAQDVLNLLVGSPVAIVPPIELVNMDAVLRGIARQNLSYTNHVVDANHTGALVTGIMLLEGAMANTSKQWYVVDAEFPRLLPEIRIVGGVEEFARARLSQVIDFSFRNETGESILRTVAGHADMSLRFGPSVSDLLAKEISLEAQNMKLRDVLQKTFNALGVVGRIETTFGYVGILSPSIRAEEPTKRAEPEMPAGSYVGKISIPMDGGKYFIEFMLRESDLTEELRRVRQEKVREIIEQLSKAAGQER